MQDSVSLMLFIHMSPVFPLETMNDFVQCKTVLLQFHAHLPIITEVSDMDMNTSCFSYRRIEPCKLISSQFPYWRKWINKYSNSIIYRYRLQK